MAVRVSNGTIAASLGATVDGRDWRRPRLATRIGPPLGGDPRPAEPIPQASQDQCGRSCRLGTGGQPGNPLSPDRTLYADPNRLRPAWSGQRATGGDPCHQFRRGNADPRDTGEGMPQANRATVPARTGADRRVGRRPTACRGTREHRQTKVADASPWRGPSAG
jgi:hypothetical protein